jgi:hypothetical protein
LAQPIAPKRKSFSGSDHKKTANDNNKVESGLAIRCAQLLVCTWPKGIFGILFKAATNAEREDGRRH